jgi:hypothetical protein
MNYVQITTNKQTNKQTNNKGTKSHRPRSRVLAWEAKTSSASQEIPRILCNSKVHCRVHKRPPLVRIIKHTNPLHATHSIFWRFIFSDLCLGFPNGLFPSDCHTKPRTQLSSPSHVLLASPNSLFLISSLEEYLVRSTNHAAPHYAVSCYLVLLGIKNLPQHPALKQHPAYVPPLI